MNDSGSAFPSFRCELSGTVMKEGVDEGSVGIPGGRMNDHAVGFVQEDDFIIFVEDREREVFGIRFNVRFFGDRDCDEVTLFERGSSLD